MTEKIAQNIILSEYKGYTQHIHDDLNVLKVNIPIATATLFSQQQWSWLWISNQSHEDRFGSLGLTGINKGHAAGNTIHPVYLKTKDSHCAPETLPFPLCTSHSSFVFELGWTSNY